MGTFSLTDAAKITEKVGTEKKLKSIIRMNNVLHRIVRQRRINNKPHVNHEVQSRLPQVFFAKMQLQKILRGHSEIINCIIFDRTGRYLFTAGSEKFIKVWDTTTGQLLFTFRGHEDQVSSLAVNQENQLLASGSHDKTVRVWNLNSGSCVVCLYGAGDVITKVRFHTTNGTGVVRYVLATTSAGHLMSWMYRDRKIAWIFQAYKHPYLISEHTGKSFSCFSFSASGSYLAAVLEPTHSIVIIALYADLLKSVFQEPATISQQIIYDLQFSHKDSRFVSVAKQGIVSLWSPNNKYSRWRKHLLPGAHKINDSNDLYGEPGSFIRWSIDDKYIIVIGDSGKIGVWNSSTCNLPKILQRQKATDIDTIEVHPKNPEILMTLDVSSCIDIWNIQTSQLLTSFHDDPLSLKPTLLTCSFSPNGHVFASIDRKGFLYLHGIGKNQLYDEIPTEMFFSSDYNEVSSLKDNNGTFVLDAVSSVAPSLMPKPTLVDMLNHPYSERFQELVPDRKGPIVPPLPGFLLNKSYDQVQNLIDNERYDIRDHFTEEQIRYVDKTFRETDGEFGIDGQIVTICNSETDYIVDVESY